MINSNLTNPMLIVGAQTAPAKAPQAPTRGDNAFEEALNGAHAVRDRNETSTNVREANAARISAHQQAQADKHDAKRADALRAEGETHDDRSVSKDSDAKTVSADTKVATKADGAEATTDTGDAATTVVADPTAEAAVAAEAGTAVATDAAAHAAAQLAAGVQASVVVAAAPVVTADVQVAATATDVAAASTTAVDAALKLAIDAAATSTVDGEAVATTAQVQTQATASVDAEAIDAILQPTVNAAAAATTAEDGAAALTTPTQNGSTAQDAEVLVSADAQVGQTRPDASKTAQTIAGPTPGAISDDAAASVQPMSTVAVDTDVPATATAAVSVKDAAAPVVAAPIAQVVDEAAAVTTPVVAAAAQATANTDVNAGADAVDTTVTDATVTTTTAANAKVATGDTSTDADASGEQAGAGTKAQADAILQPTKPVVTAQAPALTQQLETAIQASQVRAAEKEAIADGGAAPTQTSVKPLEATSNLLQNLQAGARAEVTTTTTRTGETVLPQAMQERIDTIADQLATRLRLSQAAGGTQVQLALKPRELGDVMVRMEVRDGVVAASVLVDRPDALNTIGNHIEELRRSLENQGLSIQRLDVDVRDWTGNAGANAQAFADARNGGSNGRQHAAAHSNAGGLGAIPGLTSDREVDVDEAHEGDVSVLI